MHPTWESNEIQLYLGDVEDILPTLPGHSAVACLCDPPYGLGEVKAIHALLTAWLNGDDGKEQQTAGFMGHDWDITPSPSIWREVLRVLAPGALVLAFSGARTCDLLGVSMRLAGFRDSDMLVWLVGSAFTKATDVAKQVDKNAGAEREVVGRYQPPKGTVWNLKNDRGGGFVCNGDKSRAQSLAITASATPLAQVWDGWKYGKQTLKPCATPVLMMQAPWTGRRIEAITGTGAGSINVDGCRLPTAEDRTRPPRTPNAIYGGGKGTDLTASNSRPQGRFPTNCLLSHLPECVERGVKRTKPLEGYRANPVAVQADGQIQFNEKPPGYQKVSYTDPDGLETVVAFDCVDGCPVRALDEMSEVSGSNWRKNKGNGDGVGMFGVSGGYTQGQQDAGTASRFYYCSKSSRRERELGLRGHLPCVKCGGMDSRYHFEKKDGQKWVVMDASVAASMPERKEFKKRKKAGEFEDIRDVSCIRNPHPTVKPIGITEYLARLLLPPPEYRDDATLLIPFAGTMSEVVGAIQAGWRNIVAIERDEASFEVGKYRVMYWQQQLQARLL